VREVAPSPFKKNELFGKQPYSNENMTKLRLNVGRMHGFNVPKLFEVVNSQRNIKGIQIGDIKLESDHTFVEIDKTRTTMFINALNNKNVMGVNIKVQLAEANPPKATYTPSAPVSAETSAPRSKSFAPRMRGKEKGKFKKKY
jgi:ribosomal protein L12E/L44/L45/RPP1/RPP2